MIKQVRGKKLIFVLYWIPSLCFLTLISKVLYLMSAFAIFLKDMNRDDCWILKLTLPQQIYFLANNRDQYYHWTILILIILKYAINRLRTTTHQLFMDISTTSSLKKSEYLCSVWHLKKQNGAMSFLWAMAAFAINHI